MTRGNIIVRKKDGEAEVNTTNTAFERLGEEEEVDAEWLRD